MGSGAAMNGGRTYSAGSGRPGILPAGPAIHCLLATRSSSWTNSRAGRCRSAVGAKACTKRSMAKERVPISDPAETIARLSFQRFFRCFQRHVRYDRHRPGGVGGIVAYLWVAGGSDPDKSSLRARALAGHGFCDKCGEVDRGGRPRNPAAPRVRPPCAGRHAERRGERTDSASCWRKRILRSRCSTPSGTRRRQLS